MIKLKTKNIRHKDAKKIREFVKVINEQAKQRQQVDLYLKKHSGIIVHCGPDFRKTIRCFGFYSPSEKMIYGCYEGLELQSILEIVAHEYKHFLQDLEGKDTGSKGCEREAEKFAKEVVASFLKNK